MLFHDESRICYLNQCIEKLDKSKVVLYILQMRLDTLKITKIVSSNITLLREKHKMSVIELSKKCKVTRQTIYNIENGTHLPNQDLTSRLSSVFNVEEHELYQINTKIK